MSPWLRGGFRGPALAYAALFVIGFAVYAFRVGSNPPGFYIDESSIAYNAHLVSEAGRDEHGEPFPLFFRAFGDYKNPVYVYLLSGLFFLTGPSILAARLLSAALGVVCAFVLGLLGARVSGRARVGPLIMLSALLTPWLFELSRVVLEVALYPLAVALFLFALRRAAEKSRWSWADAATLAATLVLVTYTYSTGRLTGPLFAVGLLLFVGRAGFSSVVRAWLLYALALAPLFVFHWRHPGALTGRFSIITYATPKATAWEVAREFAKHFFGNLDPWRMLVTGDPNPNQIASLYNVGLVLAVTFALAVAGALVVLRRRAREPFWRFVFYGLAASLVPASLTNEYFHMLRLSALPVFLLLLAANAAAWLAEERRRRAALVVVLVLTLAQGLFFQWQYHAHGRSPRRSHLFDVDYATKILPAALAEAPRPVHLADAQPIPGYIQAYWHGVLQSLPPGTFKLLPTDAPAPEGAVVITTENACPRCRTLAASEPYTVYVAEGPPRAYAPLPPESFRASIRTTNAPAHARPGEVIKLVVFVRNDGPSPWPARERSGSPFQLSLGNHWLDADGREVIHDDGRAPLIKDQRPGEEQEFELVVNAPKAAGDYLLELDMLQEGVSWFGLKGSQTLRLPVRVEAGWLD